MSVQYCGVVGCPNGPGGKSAMKTERVAGDDAWLAFHRVPSVEPRRSLWLTAVAFRKLEEKKLLVCSLHFRREDYTFDPVLCLSLGAYKRPFLNSDAVPSLLLGYDEQAPLQGEICGVPNGPMQKSSRTRDNAVQTSIIYTRNKAVQGHSVVKRTSNRGVQTGGVQAATINSTRVCHCKRSGRGAWCGSSMW